MTRVASCWRRASSRAGGRDWSIRRPGTQGGLPGGMAREHRDRTGIVNDFLQERVLAT